jgi:3-oxoacyl-[acyl-carrier protein] reductase
VARLSKLSRSIEGRVAVVTGAASGMGRATAHLFGDEGAYVAVVDRSREGVADVVDELRAEGLRADGFTCDVSDSAQIDRCVAAVTERLGPIDILVNNAGVSMLA